MPAICVEFNLAFSVFSGSGLEKKSVFYNAVVSSDIQSSSLFNFLVLCCLLHGTFATIANFHFAVSVHLTANVVTLFLNCFFTNLVPRALVTHKGNEGSGNEIASSRKYENRQARVTD